MFSLTTSRGRPRSVSKEESFIEAQEDEEEEDEARIPGMPSKPCPQCDERFTTREGFLEHIVVHSSIVPFFTFDKSVLILIYLVTFFRCQVFDGNVQLGESCFEGEACSFETRTAEATHA